MSSRRFIKVLKIKAFSRLGVHNPLFGDKLQTERANVIRSSSTRAKKCIFKLLQEFRGGRKHKPKSSSALYSGDSTTTSCTNGSESDERSLATLFTVRLAETPAVDVISDWSKEDSPKSEDGATPLIAGPPGDCCNNPCGPECHTLAVTCTRLWETDQANCRGFTTRHAIAVRRARLGGATAHGNAYTIAQGPPGRRGANYS